MATIQPGPSSNNGAFSPNGTIVVAAVDSDSTSSRFTTNQSVFAANVTAYNAGPNDAFVGFGATLTGGVTAAVPTSTESLNSQPFPAKSWATFTKGIGNDLVAARCATGGSATLYFTAGEGD